MKKSYLVLFIFALSMAYLFCSESYAAKLKNPFNKQSKQNHVKIQSEPENQDNTLKAKAVYLELEGDNVEYDHENNLYITYGMSVAHIVDQNARLEADKIIYYGDDQHIEAVGNIKIIRQNIVTVGESFKFDVNSNKYLLTRPSTNITGAVIKARTVSSGDNNQIEYEKGRLRLGDPIRIAQGFGVRQRPRTFYSFKTSVAERKTPSWNDVSPKQRYKVTAEKIVYDSEKKINNLTIYGARVHFKHFSLPAVPKFTTTVSSDPNVRTAPLLTPTLGTQGALGGFAIGPRFNFNLTDYHILSLSPFGQIGSEGATGLGGMIGFYGPTTILEGAYGSLKDRFIGQFRQKLGTKTEFRAAYNKYLDNGFLGSTLAKLNIEIVDRRKIKLPFTETGINFRTAGNWAQSDQGILPSRFKNFLKDAGDPKDFKNSAFKFEEQISAISKPIFKFGNEKYNTAFRLKTQNALRAYSTGDLQGIFTGGPLLDNKIGPLSFELGYNQGFVKGESPLFYDQFIQGRQSVLLDGDIKLHEWVTLGGYGTYNIKASELVERQFRAKVGPKDFKMLVNWDALRQQTQFGLNFLFGEPVDFERFLIINSQNKTSGI
jgi:Skp family chaperone for outer membrane proteins